MAVCVSIQRKHLHGGEAKKRTLKMALEVQTDKHHLTRSPLMIWSPLMTRCHSLCLYLATDRVIAHMQIDLGCYPCNVVLLAWQHVAIT